MNADNIAMRMEAKGLKTDPTYDIRLYDGLGNLLRQTTSNGEKTQFNVNGLKNGTYYLHIYDGINDKPKMQQVIIQR